MKNQKHKPNKRDNKLGIMLFDVFICHASEDKNEFVRPLADKLTQLHLEVWYDEFTLKLGDSLRRSIDRGLARSRYGIVVLSPSFFKKDWPQRELDGLVARETSGTGKIILPIWHRITKEEICQYSPTLADRWAIPSSKELEEVARRIVDVVRPRESPLVVAKERLTEIGLPTPVVTDEWWLDVVGASNREPGWGFIPEQESWGRWTFPLPSKGDSPRLLGERLAWTAMQMIWEYEANHQHITQVTRPDVVLNFIDSQKGLREACYKYPHFLASYAPQLTVRDLGGDFEEAFDELLNLSVKQHKRQSRLNDRFGSALSTKNKCPACDLFIALRHPTFGEYRPEYIACQFVQGELNGPQVKAYETVDYLVWLLSDESGWIPDKIRNYLLEGMKEWTTWLWSEYPTNIGSELGLKHYPEQGALQNAIYSANTYRRFKLNKTCREDISSRFQFSIRLLGIKQPVSGIVDRFWIAISFGRIT